MGRAFLVAIFAFGAIASVLTTGGPPESEAAPANADEGATAKSPSSEELSAPAQEPSGEAIELDRRSDGHFYADVEVNGQPINFLIDTGASGIALTRKDARRAGLATSISMPQVVGEGASGAVRGEIVTLDRVSLGSAKAADVPAIVLDGGSKSLLGQSFLSKFATVEIRGDTMILE